MAKEESPTIGPGTMLWGTYRAVRVIGVGGMGVVVHAERLAPRDGEAKDVAIKFLLPQFAASKEAATRFVREARAVTRIQSDHVARVLDVGTSDEHGPFIAMEYLAGSDLSRQIRKGLRAPIEGAIDLVAQAADALAHAHAQGVVHRDVKPANLFVADREGRPPIVKVLDFGISKLADDADLGVTKTTTVLGSGLYMSPEQMRSAKGVDHRTDVYGLGITLYEVLSGTQPFTAETYPDLCIKVAMDPPDPLRRHRADVPEELAVVIARAYARKPEDRYASIGDFMAALAPWASSATAARILAIQQIGRPHLRLASSPSIPPPADDDAGRERSADMWRDALATPKPLQPSGSTAQPSIPGGLSKTSSTSLGSTISPPERDTSARTVVLTAVGTFVVLAATVAIYVFAIRGRTSSTGTPDASMSAEPTSSAPIAAHQTPPSPDPKAPAPSSAANADPTAASAPVDSASALPPSPSIAAAPPNAWTPPKGATPAVTTPAPAPSPTPAPPATTPGDPFACVNPITHLREACH